MGKCQSIFNTIETFLGQHDLIADKDSIINVNGVNKSKLEVSKVSTRGKKID